MESEAQSEETVNVAAAATEPDASWGYVVLVLLVTLVLGEAFRRWTKSAPAESKSAPAAPAATKSKTKSAVKSKKGSAAAPAAKSTPEPAAKSEESAAPAAESNPESAAAPAADSAAKSDGEAAPPGSATNQPELSASQVAPPLSPQDLMERLDSIPVFTMVQQATRRAGCTCCSPLCPAPLCPAPPVPSPLPVPSPPCAQAVATRVQAARACTHRTGPRAAW